MNARKVDENIIIVGLDEVHAVAALSLQCCVSSLEDPGLILVLGATV